MMLLGIGTSILKSSKITLLFKQKMNVSSIAVVIGDALTSRFSSFVACPHVHENHGTVYFLENSLSNTRN